MAIDIGAAFKITAGVSGQQALDKLNSSLSQTQNLARNAAMGLAGLGAGFGLSVLKQKFDDMVAGMNGIKDGAEKIGSTVEKFGALAQAAKITNQDIGTVEAGIIKMNKALAGSDDDTKGAAHALDAIGLSMAKLKQMDPADAFREIAIALSKFEEGGGKTAVVMDIFGKNGAQLLPFLKDYVEVGDQVSRVTAEQAELAEEYERNTLKLAAAKGELYKVIGSQVLPVANAFIKALLETNQQTGGLKEGFKGLAQDGTLTMIFKEAARAAAAFLDILTLIAKGVKQVGESLAVVTNDIVTVAQIAMKAPTALFKHGGVEEIRDLWRQRGAFTAAANEDMKARWSGSMTPYSDALERQFSQMGQPAAPSAPRSKGLNGYTSNVGGATQKSPYETEMENLGRAAAKNQFMADHISEYAEKISSATAAQIQFDIEQGKFKDLTAEQKKNLLGAAQAVDTYAEKLRQAKEGLAYDNETKKIEANTRALGESALQKQIIIALQDLENKGIKKGTELYDQLSQRRIEALKRQDAESKSMATGWKQGINDYLESVSDMAKQTSAIVSKAFNGMADALTEFVMTGKLNFADLANSIIRDIIRIQIQKGVTGPLANAIGGVDWGSIFGGGGSSVPIDGYAGGGYTGGSARSGGMDGQGGFLAMLHPQETVIDHARGQGMGSSVVVNVAVDASGQTKTSGDGDGARLGNLIGAAVRAEIIQQQRPGGLLAAA